MRMRARNLEAAQKTGGGTGYNGPFSGHVRQYRKIVTDWEMSGGLEGRRRSSPVLPPSSSYAINTDKGQSILLLAQTETGIRIGSVASLVE